MTRPPCGGPANALYTNCILALDIDIGEIEWCFQVVPSDNWDLDATHESMLVDLVVGGVERKALIETSKIGWGVVLDRETGRPETGLYSLYRSATFPQSSTKSSYHVREHDTF